ncbi:uncharacterized protein At2g29880-like [Telopea speciosissima]|uniref:uncharacterized protein At2g29880-like n=1 Tax=Telopea speciosissima TaxID=54955 RepID=UPI001CC34CAE|nr:uncharacterized protein At2g29880-like [Telopea speciosissima]
MLFVVRLDIMSSSSTQATHVTWNVNEVDKFVYVMIENVMNGQKTNTTFSKVGWNNIQTEMEQMFQRPFSKDQLRQKMYKLQKDYHSFKKLLETTGFGWDHNSRTATAEDSVWDSAIKANPTWRIFRRNGLPWWPELCEIFSNTSANGERGVTTQRPTAPPPIIIDEQLADEIGPQDSSLGLNEIDPTDVQDCTTPPTTKQKRDLDKTPNDRRKKSASKAIVGIKSDFTRFINWKIERADSVTPTSSAAPPVVSTTTVQPLTVPPLDPTHHDGPYSIKACQIMLDNI